MLIKDAYNRYMEFSRRDKFTFYTMRLSETLLVGLIISRIFSMSTIDSIIMIVIGLIVTPVGYTFSKQIGNKNKM